MTSEITTSAVRSWSDGIAGRAPRVMTGELDGWLDRSVIDVEGMPLGVVVDIAPDGASGRPAWLLIYAGLRETPIVPAPVRGASLLGEHVIIAHERSAVVSAPAVDDVAALSDDDHRSLSRHYGCSNPASTETTRHLP